MFVMQMKLAFEPITNMTSFDVVNNAPCAAYCYVYPRVSNATNYYKLQKLNIGLLLDIF